MLIPANCSISGALTSARCWPGPAPLPALPCAYPELWGTLGKKKETCWGGPPRPLSLPLSLSPSLSSASCNCPICLGSWPSQPLSICYSFPLLFTASPLSTPPPWRQPQATTLSFQPEAPRFSNHGLTELQRISKISWSSTQSFSRRRN